MRRVKRSPIIPTDEKALSKAVTTELTEHANRLNLVLPTDGTEPMTGPLELMTYTVATEPAAADHPGKVIYISDGAAGTKFRGSDGTNWLSLG